MASKYALILEWTSGKSTDDISQLRPWNASQKRKVGGFKFLLPKSLAFQFADADIKELAFPSVLKAGGVQSLDIAYIGL